jgi:Tol biopolymer transport system component
MSRSLSLLAVAALTLATCEVRGQQKGSGSDPQFRPAPDALRPMDVFKLEYASDPQISPDGKTVVYTRHFMDVLKDRRRSNLWVGSADGSDHRPLTTGNHGDHSPRWSPDGKRLVYVSDAGGSPQLYCRWMDTGQTAKLTDAIAPPGGPAWSPDGKLIAFTQPVPDPAPPFVELPAKPEGAEWAAAPKVIRRVIYRADGAGYLKDEHVQVFVVPADGGAPRQLTDGPYHHGAPLAWAPDGKALLFSANRHPDGELDPLDSEVYELTLRDRSVKALTDRRGPDAQPALSPDGKWVAYVGFDDQRKGYQAHHLYVMNRDGTGRRLLAAKLDRDVRQPAWSKDGAGVYFLYDDGGTTRVGFAPLEGEARPLAGDVGGEDVGRPYAGGSFTAAGDGTLAFTLAGPSGGRRRPGARLVHPAAADRPERQPAGRPGAGGSRGDPVRVVARPPPGPGLGRQAAALRPEEAVPARPGDPRRALRQLRHPLQRRAAAVRRGRLRRALRQPARQHRLRRGVRPADRQQLPRQRLRRLDGRRGRGSEARLRR